MSQISIDLRIVDPAWKEISDLESLADRAFGSACSEIDPRPAGEVAILLTDDAEMQALNREWRGKDKPTDVLSFPADDMQSGFLGDLALGYEICARDARKQGISLADHTAHLLIHGFYHLLGYDHETEAEAAVMEGLEVSALARLGLPDPYSRIT